MTRSAHHPHAPAPVLALCALALAALAAALAPASALAGKPKSRQHKRTSALVVLRDPATGFTARAPRGFTITHDLATGVEEISSATRGAFVTYLLVDSGEAPSALAQTLISQSQSSTTSTTQSAGTFTAAVIHAGHAETLRVRQVAAGLLAVTVWGTAKPKPAPRKKAAKHPRKGRKAARIARAAHAASASLQQLLAQIAAGAQGGHAVAPPTQQVPKPVAAVALQSFTNEDKSATAEVPSGFHCTGKIGQIECTEPAHGELEYGIGAPVCTAGMEKALIAEQLEPSLCPVIAPFMENPADAATTIWPGLLDKYENAKIEDVTVTSTTTEQMPGWNAALEILSFKREGAPWTGAMFAATTANTGSPEEWLFYYSEISVPNSDNSSYGQALAKSWSTFNPSAAEQQRTSEAEKDMQGTAGVIKEVGDFKQAVADEADQQWDEYIREEPVADDASPDLF